MPTDSLFFPILKRREQYRTKKNGEYYATYGEYKQEVREDCLGRCVYCDAHENELGGPTSMNLDHFRPYAQFRHLVNDPHNLVWACGACNRGKSDHWPALGTDGTVMGNEGFVEPFVEDRRDYFDVGSDGKLVPLKAPGRYMIVLLSLNRQHSKRIRQIRLQADELGRKLDERISHLEQQADLTPQQQQFLELLKQSRASFKNRLDFRLY